MKHTFNQWARLPETKEAQHVKLFNNLKAQTIKLTKRGQTEKVKPILKSLGLSKYTELEDEPALLLIYAELIAPLISTYNERQRAGRPDTLGGLLKYDNRTV